MTEKFELSKNVEDDMAGLRLDQVAVQLFPDYSRSRLQSWIKSGKLRVNNTSAKAKDKLYGGESITLQAEVEPQNHWQAEQIPLEIVYEDEAIIIINKPIGLVVHPGAGNRTGTLLNGLLAHCPALESVPRAGIVHRLDKGTSGLLVVAKTLHSHLNLVGQLQDRSMEREYQAIVHGLITAGGMVEAHLGRHPVHRTKRAVVSDLTVDAKEAVTHFRLLKRYRSHTHVRLKLETGRTHQIRVHMAHLGFPLVGDQLYGGRPKLPKAASVEFIEFLEKFKHQALHAYHLGLAHPTSGEFQQWEVEPPEIFQQLLTHIVNDSEQ